MLDRYISGSVTRISPEAPIPVVHQEEITYNPGGAANLAFNLVNLGVEVDLMGVVGADEEGSVLKKLCSEAGINCLFSQSPGKTITKTRVIAKNQQIVRIDQEDERSKYSVISILPETLDLKKYNLIIVCDYNKGFCNPDLVSSLIKMAGHNSIQTIVDPKGKRWEKYMGASLIKPNLNELSEFLGFAIDINQKFVDEIRYKLKQYDIDKIIVSLAENGLLYIDQNNVTHFKAPRVEVYDVSGAGDTVMAVIAFGILEDYSLDNTLSLAVKCGSFVVTKAKTYAIKKDDLEKIRDLEPDLDR